MGGGEGGCGKGGLGPGGGAGGGGALVIWIAVQIRMVGYQGQASAAGGLMGVLGVILILLSLTGSVRRPAPPPTTSP